MIALWFLENLKKSFMLIFLDPLCLQNGLKIELSLRMASLATKVQSYIIPSGKRLTLISFKVWHKRSIFPARLIFCDKPLKMRHWHISRCSLRTSCNDKYIKILFPRVSSAWRKRAGGRWFSEKTCTLGFPWCTEVVCCGDPSCGTVAHTSPF